MRQMKHDLKTPRTALSRRGFLKTAAALSASGALPGIPGTAWARDGVLRVRSYADMRTLDPAFSQGVPDEEIQAPIYNKLIQYQPGREWGWQLDAAAMIEQSDPTHIRFALRDDIGFTNGFGPMTAEDVKFSFERVVADETESNNKPDMGPLSHVEVNGEREGVIVLKEPFAPLWTIALPYITGNIVCKKAVEAAEGRRIGTDPLAESGPYLRQEWRPKERTVLVRNPDWRGARPAFDRIEILPIDDEKTAETAMEAGELDFTRVSLGSVERLRQGAPDGTRLGEYPSLYYVWLGMNLDHPNMQSPELRRAIQAAVDIPSIMQAAYFGAAEPSTGIIAPGLAGHRERALTPPQADPEKARELLEKSGYDGRTLILDTLNKNAFVAACEVIQANLAAVGISVEVNVHEAATFFSLGDESSGERWKDVQILLNRFSMTPDPYYATAWFTREQVGVWNWERFRSEEFDRLHEAAYRETDNGKRAEMYRRMQDLMEESGAYRFITHEATPVLYSEGVRPALRPDGLPLLRYFGRA